MRNRIFSTIVAVVSCIAVSAQGTCIINGHIADCKLADGKKIKKVYLTRTNEFGQVVDVAATKVKKGNYTFKYALACDEPVLQYALTGFGEGQDIEIFVEPGRVEVNTQNAAQAGQSRVTGTPTNDTYADYRAIAEEGSREVARQIAALEECQGSAWLETPEGKNAVKRIKATEDIKMESQTLRFLIDHNASPMMPLEVERALLPKLSAAYAEQMSKAVAYSLQQHPYYLSLRNTVLANSMKVGSEAPDITLPLLDGGVVHLNDYRGKYVILNFWAEAEQAAAMMAELQKVYEQTREQREQFVFISIFLGNDMAAWKKAVADFGIACEGWSHACDGAGVNSPAAKRYGVEKTPRIVFVEPEGHVISLDMELDEISMRVEQIMMGDLYYFDQEK